MFVKPSQMANVSTLLDAKKMSSFVISRWSNNRMQRSAASKSHIVTSLLHAAPADADVRPTLEDRENLSAAHAKTEKRLMRSIRLKRGAV